MASFTANTSLTAPVANPIFDLVPNGTAIVTNKNDVATQSCNMCHDPLSFHGGGRTETKFCVVCHNPTLPSTTDNVTGLQAGSFNFVTLVHRIHSDNTLTNKVFSTTVNFNEVTYPQAIQNCTTCHSGPAAADNTYANWMNRPSREGCGSCHTSVNFATGAGHGPANVGGARADDSACALCHPATGAGPSVTNAHATENVTPNNPQLPVATPALVNLPVRDRQRHGERQQPGGGQVLDQAGGCQHQRSSWSLHVLHAPDGQHRQGHTARRLLRGPAFLLAFAMPQDGVSAPADYNNLGAGGNPPATGRAGQPQSVSLVGLTVSGTSTQYTTTLTTGVFPAGAKMRAVALQGYFTQTGVTIRPAVLPINVGRHAISVQKAVTGDAVRRNVIKSGYNATTGAPEGCLECHEFFEGHGGNRNNNVQVCVMCHNPNLSTSGRTIVAVPPVVINPSIVALYGSNPLTYPEVTDNLKSLIHGFHASGDDPATSPNEFVRSYPYIDIRNRAETPATIGVLLDGSEVTYPGNLMHCTKCHYGPTVPAGDTNPPGFVANSYKADLPANLLNTTTKITTGNAAENAAQIIGARNTVPNSTDLVVSPLASACGYCHDSNTQVSHMILNGAAVNVQRGDANLTPPQLAPDVLATP